MRFGWLLVVGALLLCDSPRARAAGGEPLVIKLATLAPRGSTWANLLERSSKRLFDATSGRVKFQYYFGGIQGDDRDVVRKIKLGQLAGGAVTGVGLGMINGDVRVLELPFMFKTVEELDYVRDKLIPYFAARFEKEGYVLLAWGDVGWVHLYGKKPVSSRADAKGMKMWLWPDDPLQTAMYEKMGLHGVPMGVPEVLTGLQTGRIDGCHGPPLAAVALQWYTQVKYASAEGEAYAVGGFILRKDVWDKIAPEDQALIKKGIAEQQERLRATVRKDNERAKAAMKNFGIEFLPSPPELRAKAEETAKKVRVELAGKVYSKEVLELVEKHLAEYRAKKKS